MPPSQPDQHEPIIETIQLERLGDLTLGAAAGPKPEVRDVGGFACSADRRVGFVRRNFPAADELVMTDYDGKVLKNIPIPKQEELDHARSWVGWLGGDRWVIGLSGYRAAAEDEDTSMFCLLRWDGATETWTRLLEPASGSIEVMESTPLAIALLVRSSEPYTINSDIRVFDVDGKPKWNSFSSGYTQSLPDDIAITSSGQIVSIDNIPQALHVLDGSGKLSRSISLDDSWGWEPNYPSGVAPDANDGFIVYDFNGDPPIVRMNADGKVIGSF